MTQISATPKYIPFNWTAKQFSAVLLLIGAGLICLLEFFSHRHSLFSPASVFQRYHLDDVLLVLVLTVVSTVLLRRKLSTSERVVQALSDSERRLNIVYDMVDEAIVLMDGEGNIQECNRMTLLMYQYERDELIGQPFTRLQSPHYSFVSSLREADASPEVNEAEHVRKDGKAFPVEVRTKTLRYGRDHFQVFIVRDITRRKRTEAALSEERFLFNTLMDNITDTIYFKDREGRFLRVNSAFVPHVGGCQHPAEVIGQTDFDIFAEQHAMEAYADEQRVIETGEPLLGKVEKETYTTGKQATWVSTSKLPLRDPQGKVIGTFGISRDVTEMKRAEDALKRHERFMTSIFTSIQDGISVLSADLQIMQVNKAMETFFPQETQFVGRKCYEAYHHRSTPCEACPTLRTIASGQVETETILQHNTLPAMPDTWLEVFSFPLQDADSGQVTGVIEYVRDITARKQAEDELQQLTAELARSNEELQQFAYVASHDLQEPLRMVASYVQLLSRRYKGKLDADADEFIQYAVDGASRMKDLINDLLTYSRVGTQGKAFTSTDCNEVLKKALTNLQLAIEDNHAEIRIDPLPTITVDGSQLIQLFQNLIGNALKFHRQDVVPVIDITVRHEADHWLFAVRDNGIGIAPQFSEKIFAIFQRLHNKEEYPGTGIGLAVCRKIVERHGGAIWVESEVGQGTTFFFTLAHAARPDAHVRMQ